MKKLTKELAFSIISTNYLTEETPLDFLKWSVDKQDKFIRDNVWEPFENEDEEFIFSMIDNASIDLINRLEQLGSSD